MIEAPPPIAANLSDAFPRFPSRMTRDERRAWKSYVKDFEGALKLQAKSRGWKTIQNCFFAQVGDWFIMNTPFPVYGGGVGTGWAAKPMALDPLFWDIVQLPENSKAPLSFRAVGAWVLRPAQERRFLASDNRDPEDLAGIVLDWSDQRRADAKALSLAGMLEVLGPLDATRGSSRSIAICLLILLDRLEEAHAMCRSSLDEWTGFGPDSGGFTVGVTTSFYHLAHDWLIDLRRKATTLAE